MHTVSQVFAVLIFLSMFTAIILNRVPRYVSALVGCGRTIVIVFLLMCCL